MDKARSTNTSWSFRPRDATGEGTPVCWSKGLVDPAALDTLVDTYEHKVGRATAQKVEVTGLGR